jgi:hypothetical protein
MPYLSSKILGCAPLASAHVIMICPFGYGKVFKGHSHRLWCIVACFVSLQGCVH